MTDLENMAQSAKASAAAPRPPVSVTTGYDSGLKKQYFAKQTKDYARQIGEYASNVYDAQAQGLNPSDFYEWRQARIRVSPINQGSTGEIMPDDWQRLHILKPGGIDTVPIGAYLTFADNTWIVYKGLNMGSVLGDGIMRRCNAVITTLDWYGNLVKVPISFAKMGTLGNASHATENSIVAKNYMACVCQRNPVSASFTENTRIILGSTAYSLRGVNDFTREFTDDPESVHMMTFTIERSEVLEQDSLYYQCADYHTFDWRLNILAPRNMKIGMTQQITVESRRMGEVVTNTEEKPISYTYSSDNTDVATVDQSGIITAIAEGTATITVTLSQNPNISKTLSVDVANTGSRFVEFTSTPVPTLREYESVIISAAVFEDGAQTDEPVNFKFSGAPRLCYDVDVETEPNTVTLTAYGASNEPLVVTAKSGNLSAEMSIILISR